MERWKEYEYMYSKKSCQTNANTLMDPVVLWQVMIAVERKFDMTQSPPSSP